MGHLAVKKQSPYSLKVLRGSGKGKVFQLLGQKVSIGRKPDNDISLDDERCSRYHAVLDFIPQGVILKEISSKSRMSVNGNLTKKAFLSSGDQFQVGNTIFLFQVSHQSKAPLKARRKSSKKLQNE